MKPLNIPEPAAFEHEIYSPTPSDDLRAAPRQRTLYRVACVRTAADRGMARVQNLSDDGMMLRLSLPVLLGDAVDIQLSETVNIPGRVVWTHGTECGIKLTHAIDSGALLKHIADQTSSKGTRALRLPVSKKATVSSEMGIHAGEVDDISQWGMKVKHDGRFSAGLQVKITLHSGLQRRGVVRWSEEGIAGILLLEPFSPDELGSALNL
jgi:hypothetical protein